MQRYKQLPIFRYGSKKSMIKKIKNTYQNPLF